MRSGFSHLFELDIAERLQLVEDLWDSIASDSDNVPLLQWQKDEIKRRREAHRLDPSAVSSWEDVEKRIRARHV
jgi:putative addiction module component (TIGR02574 family)